MLLFTHIYLIFKPSNVVFFNTYYPIYIAALFFIYLNRRLIKLNRDFIFIAILCLGLTFIAFVNSMLGDIFDRRYVFTWLAWLTVLFSIACTVQMKDVLSILVSFSKVVIVIQLIIVSIQLFEPNAFGYFWSSIENRGLDRDVRVSGSLSSPTEFAFLMTYLLILVIARRGPVKEFLWVMVILIMILMSGSRAFILGCPLIIGAWFYLESNDNLALRLMKSALFAILMYVLLFLILLYQKDTLIYSAELLRILPLTKLVALLVETEVPVFQWLSVPVQQLGEYIGSTDFLSDRQLKSFEKHAPLRTFVIRAEAWNSALIEFFFRSTWGQVTGSHSSLLNSGHQDYIFMLSRYGVLGLIMYLCLLGSLLSLAYKNKNISEGRVLYLVCLLVIGSGTANIIGVEMRASIFIAITAGLLLSNKCSSRSSIKEY